MVEFAHIITMDPGFKRTAALAQWVQGLYHRERNRPVLVGGAAVELLTGGAYVTGGLDLVGSVTHAVATAMKQAGFTREGRHWFHEEERIFLEFASPALRKGEEAWERTFGDCSVLIISAEDLLVDRLAEWVKWRSAMDGISAFLLYRAVEAEMDLRKLEGKAGTENVYTALNAVRDLFTVYEGAVPEDELIEEWSRRVPR